MIRRITHKPWFGPKRTVGWGWRVTSWQGAVVLTLFLFCVFMIALCAHTTVVGALGAITLAVLFVIIALLTGDPPGGADFHTGI